MIYEYLIRTKTEEFVNITDRVREALTKSVIAEGICVVFCPHTTAGLTINENADPDVIRDLLFALDKTYPHRTEFRHSEGNSPAHLKASTMGSSLTLLVTGGKLVLGTWQGVYFCEFDGPRSRTFYVKVMEG